MTTNGGYRRRIEFTDDATDAEVKHLRNEIAEVAVEADEQARHARKLALFWNAAYLSLGLPTAILAAVSGATGLASEQARIPAALLALISAALTATSTFLRCDVRAIGNNMHKSAWRVLEADAHLAAAQYAYTKPELMKSALEELLRKRRAIFAGELEVALQISPTGLGATPLDVQGTTPDLPHESIRSGSFGPYL